jgi:hypothetical protein
MHPTYLSRIPRLLAPLVLAVVLALLAQAPASAEVLRNDGWEDGENAGFQGGFVAGEIGAARLVPTESCPCALNTVELLFGGTTGQQTVTLRIWDDSNLTDNPGPELFSGDYLLTGADNAINVIDLSAEGITINGPIRVGIEFQHSGFPSIARDDDGSIDITRNFIFTSGVWFRSNLFGLTGDWIIRATTTPTGGGFTIGGTVSGFAGNLVLQNNGGDDLLISSNGPFTFPTALPDGSPYDVTVLSEPEGSDCIVLNGSGTINGANVTNIVVDCGSSILRNDGWEDGEVAVFQGGFVAGEIGAVRLVPTEPCPCDLNRVELLFGGSTGVATVTLRIWDDTNEQLDPGPELFSGDYQLTGADNAINVIDLSAENVAVTGAFRVGIEFQANGYPSIARDNDGTINVDRNFIYTSGTWFRSSLFGLTGDWIIRAALEDNTTSVSTSGLGGRLLVSPTPYTGGELTISFATEGATPGESLADPNEPVDLAVFDGSGRLVRQLASGTDRTGAGAGETVWDGRDGRGNAVGSGVYFVRQLAGGYVWSQKVTVVR